MDKEKKEKKVKQEVPTGEENFILKKIRYYQGTIKDYDTFWNEKIAEGEREESPETKAFAKRNAELNKAFEIIPVEKDETVICKDVVSGKDSEAANDNKDTKPASDDEKKEEKKEKKEEKHEEEEEVKEKDEKKEEKDEDDDDDEKKKKDKKED